MAPRFFPENTIHEFEYQPLYYDARKEAMRERIAKARKELDKEDAQETRILTHGTFKRMISRRHKEVRKSNMRIVIIAAIFILGAYFLLYR